VPTTFAIQCRITSEDPELNFQPDSGRIQVRLPDQGITLFAGVPPHILLHARLRYPFLSHSVTPSLLRDRCASPAGHALTCCG
jgi:hypothetical protein